MTKTVFVSSTYHDLEAYRRAVWDLLEGFQVNVRGMERFGARSEAPLQTCLAEVDQSDIYVGILAFRLGSLDQASGKSFTQLEYERAHEKHKDTLIYMMDEDHARIAPSLVDKGERREKLDAFKGILRERHTVATFRSERDLVDQLQRDFRRLLKPRSRAHGKDEYAIAARVIERFLLTPKAASGSEVRLQVRVTGDPFPASRSICSAFNLEFGSTVGLPVEIARPQGLGASGLVEVFFPASLADQFLPVSDEAIRDIYAKLQFADTTVLQSRARFWPQEERKLSTLFSAFKVLQEATEGQVIHHEADGKIILLLTRLPDKRPKPQQSAKSA